MWPPQGSAASAGRKRPLQNSLGQYLSRTGSLDDADANSVRSEASRSTWFSAVTGTSSLPLRRGRAGKVALRRLAFTVLSAGTLFSGSLWASDWLREGLYYRGDSAPGGDPPPPLDQAEGPAFRPKGAEAIYAPPDAISDADFAIRLYQLRQALSVYSEPGSLAVGMTNPRTAALHWLAAVDPRRLSVDDPHLPQRYILAVIYFSTNSAEWPEGGWDELSKEAAAYDTGENTMENGGTLRKEVPPFVAASPDGWKQRLHFLSELHECDWNGNGGVRSCDSEGYVMDLSLWNNLRGTVPPEIGHLSSLKLLYLSRNELSGTIPEALGRLVQLRYLGLSHNRLTGTVPSHAFGGLLRLTRFTLEKNNIRGVVRRIDPLCQLMVDAKPPRGGAYLGGSLIHLTADCQQIVAWKEPEVTCACCDKCYRAR